MSDKKSHDAKLAALSALAEEVAEQFGLSVVEVKFGQQGRRRSLEITIFRPDGSVSHTDCESVSRKLEALLDERATQGQPVVEGPFMLEVQSPGIDRAIKTEREFQLFAGQKVQVMCKEKVADLGHDLVGIMLGVSNGRLKLAHVQPANIFKTKKTVAGEGSAGKDLSIDQNKITQVRLYAPELAPKNK